MNSPMFRAMVWKELQANLKWAVFILLLLAGWLVVNMKVLGELPRDGFGDLNGLSGFIDLLLATAALGGGLAGFLLGVTQTVAESRDDNWGFLVHRPVSLSALFWSKAAAGFLLYVLSVGTPLAGALLQLASLERMPVLFDWRIALPVAANFLCGLVFYFGGMMTGMRRAPWYSSRGLGFGAALGCLSAQMVLATAFWQAITVTAIGLLMVGTAAWGTFIAGGHYHAQPVIGRLATGLSLGSGLAVVALLALSALQAPLGAQFRQDPKVDRFTTYTVTRDGRFVRLVMENGRTLQATDLDGNLAGDDWNARREGADDSGVLTALLQMQRQRAMSIQSLGWLYTQLRKPGADDHVSWYYVHRPGLIAAYDVESRHLVGWLGPDGFSPGKALPRAFPGRFKKRIKRTDNSQLLVFEGVVYSVDLDGRLVEKIFQSGPGERVLDVAVPYVTARMAGSQPPRIFLDAIRTTERLILQQGYGTRLFEAPESAETLEYPAVQLFRADPAPGVPIFLWYQGGPRRAERVVEFRGNGVRVIARTFPHVPRTASSWRRQAIAAAFFPLAGHISIDSRSGVRLRWAGTLQSGTTNMVRVGVAFLSSLLTALAIFAQGRIYAFRRGQLIVWTGLGVLAGPLGYLTMLALFEWPARESCPSCTRKRVVTRQYCEHCGAPFAAPLPDGTELFDCATANP